MSYSNTRVLLASRPVGLPRPENLTIDTVEIPPLAAGQVLIKTSLISLAPAMRVWMSPNESYVPPIGIGDVFRALAVGQVVESQHPGFAVGDYVMGTLGVRQYVLCAGDAAQDHTNPAYLLKVDTSLAPLETYLATLGLPGLTAYFGLLDTGLPQPGNTVVVSGAAGAVGSVVGQLAKLKGCHVVGLAGSQAKVD